MHELLEKSRQLYDIAVSTYKPKAVILMFSGGDDSLATYEVCRRLGIRLDAVLHGYTRTGITETTAFALNTANKNGDRCLIADAGTAYVDYIIRKGFFGKGLSAHAMSYHVLKATPFRKTVSRYFRKGRKKYPVLLLCGARWQESRNRNRMKDNPISFDKAAPNNIWLNLINDYTKDDCLSILDGVRRNPVAVQLCRSGECMCGTMQSEAEYQEAKAMYPDWGWYMDRIRSIGLSRHGWDWGQNKKKSPGPETNIQLSSFQPMCVGCTNKKS